MSGEASFETFAAGQIVLADWRGDALPREPNKRRPAIVVEDDQLFSPRLDTVILVPLTSDQNMCIRNLSIEIRPSVENGCTTVCWALSHLVTATSRMRLRGTLSRVTVNQLREIRVQICLAIGVTDVTRSPQPC